MTPLDGASPRIVRGLLVRQWLANRRWMTVYLLCGVAVLLLDGFTARPRLLEGAAAAGAEGAPPLLLWWALCWAWLLGLRCGATDALEGCEESALALPPRRAERLRTHLLFGLAAVVPVVLASSLLLHLDLPARLVVRLMDGRWVPAGAATTGFLDVPFVLLTVTLPVALYLMSAGLAGSVRRREASTWIMYPAACATATLYVAGLPLADLLATAAGPALWVRHALLLAGGVVAVAVGGRIYLRKDAVNQPLDTAGQQRTVLLILLILLGLGALASGFFVYLTLRRSARSAPPQDAERPPVGAPAEPGH